MYGRAILLADKCFFQSILRESQLALLLPTEILDHALGGQRRAQPLYIMGAQEIHQRIVHRLRVVHLLPDQEIPQGISIEPPMRKAKNRAAKRIVHDRVK